MPHVVLSGKYDFTRIYIQFKKKINKIEGSTIIKYDDSFINDDKNLILIKTIVIENQQAQSFYIVVMKKEQQITIRLDLLCRINNTNHNTCRCFRSDCHYFHKHII